jgi:hypothetical protein
MKVFTLDLTTITNDDFPKGFRFDELMEAVILNTPAQGMPSSEVIKCSNIYFDFKKAKIAQNDQNGGWSWRVSQEDYVFIKKQLEDMKWALTPKTVRVIRQFIDQMGNATEGVV